MRNYSSKQAKKGKTAYRTSSPERYQLVLKNLKSKTKNFNAQRIKSSTNSA
jgi:hypothetical protein